MPISDFHFAVCGIATVAASLGYACARRAALTLASSNGSKPDVEAGPPEERSLKRKLDDADQHDVDAEERSRPMKRNRTPPAENHQSDEDDWEVVVAPPTYEQATGLRQPEVPAQDVDTPSPRDPSTIEQDATPARESSPPPQTVSHTDEEGPDVGRLSTPYPAQVNPSPHEPDTPPEPPVTPPKPAVRAKSKPTDAFSAFSGSCSPFTSYANSSGTSPFALSGQAAKTAPAWRRDNTREPDVFGQASSANALAPSPNEVSSAKTPSSTLPHSKSAVESSGDVRSFVKSSTHPTGEEGEIVEAELKGAKLFTKRGRKEFTDGIYGHVKVLTQKPIPQDGGSGEPQETEAETNSRTRLLFRRDPLGQVSMNVGLHPTVRCHFDTAENILRVILMEQVAVEGKDSKEDVVIYAFKPGRASKADFQTFSKTLCDHKALESRVVTSCVAAGDAVAS